MHHCQGAGCSHRDHSIFVGFETPPDGAKVMFIGLGPGQDEVTTGRPFVGAAGYRFDTELVFAGISRKTECWVTNGLKFWPPDHKPTNASKEQREKGIVMLADELDAFLCGGGNVVVPLGNEAIAALLKVSDVIATTTGLPLKKKITHWRGSMLSGITKANSLVFKVIPTVHPSAVLRAWDFKELFAADLRRIKEEMYTDELDVPERELLIPGDDNYEEAYQEILGHMAAGTTTACDIETVARQLYCCAFSVDPSWAITVPGEARNRIQALLAAPCDKVWHNSMYDLTLLEARARIKALGRQHDTMLLWHAQQPELACSPVFGKGLDTLASLFTREPYWKDDLKQWKEVKDPDLFMRYNGRDAAVTLEVFNVLEPLLDAEDTRDVYEFELQLVDVFKAATIRGVPVDVAKKGRMAGGAKNHLNTVERELGSLLDEPVNLNSPKQLLGALRGLGYRLKSTGKSELQRILVKAPSDHARAYVELLLEHRRAIKEYGTFYSFKCDDDRRVRTSWNIAGTETGRLSNSKSIIFKGGLNLQTVPEQARVFFKDPRYPKWKVGYFDLNKAELRTIANLSGCEGLIAALDSADMWTTIADSLGGEFPKAALKNCVYGGLYGGGARTIVSQMNVRAGKIVTNEAEIREVLDALFNKYDDLRDWHNEVQRTVGNNLWNRTLGSTRVPAGRVRHYRPRGVRLDPSLFREALNYVPQGTVPDIVSNAIVDLHEDPEVAPHYDLWAHVHDAILCAIGKVEGSFDPMVSKIVGYMQRDMVCTDIHNTRREFIIPCDAALGETWADVSPYTVPRTGETI